MINSKLTKKAMIIAYNAHKNQLDKAGIPYIYHPIHLAEQMDTETECIVALLHDVVEDTDITYEDLLDFGYPNDYIETLKILTKNKGEYYPDYIERIIKSENVQALSIKLADLKHNMDISRIEKPTINDYVRINERYLPAYSKISEKLEELMKKGEKNVRY